MHIVGLIALIMAIALPISAHSYAAGAESQEKVWKIGSLVSGSQSSNAVRDTALRERLRELGYEEGKNIVVEYRYAEGKLDHLPQLARELVEQKPDVIVVGGTSVAVAAKKATSTIPIVVAGAGDLVEAGLIKSFMYPGGNVTGVARMSPDFFGARLKLIKEVLPKAAQIASLSNPKTPGHDRRLRDAELGARALGLQFQSVLAKTANELDGAVATAAKGGANALFVMTDSLFNNNISRIAQSAVKNRLPAVYFAELSRRAAEYVDQILKGAKPGDLTLVQPTKFDLSINLKTANQIGVVIPSEVVQRAIKVVK